MVIVYRYSSMFDVRHAEDKCFSNLLIFPYSRYQRKKHANFSHYTPEQEEKMLTMLNEVNAALAKGNKTDLLSVEEYKNRS